MNYRKLNPFRFGSPVPPRYFFGRDEALRTIFSRIYNCESTAIVGGPNSGKSSILRYLINEKVRLTWLADTANRHIFIDIDCQLLPKTYQLTDFWKGILDYVEDKCPDELIQKQLNVVRQSNYGSFTLKTLFEQLSNEEIHAILLIDEFDKLLYHPNFNTAEFFGALRSLSTTTNGLALVTASRLSVAEMNRQSKQINPLGSAFFGGITEVTLLPFNTSEVDRLIDYTLKRTKIKFLSAERDYIHRMAGRQPYLVQASAAAFFEAIVQGKEGSERYTQVDRTLMAWAIAYFEEFWQYLTLNKKKVLTSLALSELPYSQTIPVDLKNLEPYDMELRWLADSGLIEQTNNDNCALWKGAHWRISAGCLAYWIIYYHKWEDFLQLANVQIINIDEHIQRIGALREQLAIKRRRLQIREEQAAAYGLSVPPEIKIEIEDTKRGIEADELEIQSLGGLA